MARRCAQARAGRGGGEGIGRASGEDWLTGCIAEIDCGRAELKIGDKRDLLLFGVMLCVLYGFGLMIGGQGASSEKQVHQLYLFSIVDAVILISLLTAWVT